MSVHDFWSGKVAVPPGLQPAVARHAAAGQCIPQRNRITGAYQPPAAVWPEDLKTPLATQVDVLRSEIEGAWLIVAELEHDVEFYRQQVDERDDTIAELQERLQRLSAQQTTTRKVDRFEWLELETNNAVTINR